jgi:glycosyltransferase involved in cell wall biosynthesis
VRVLVTAGWLGGAGGSERALAAVLQVFERDHVDLVVKNRLGGVWAELPPSTRVSSPTSRRWSGASGNGRVEHRVMTHLGNSFRRRVGREYDLHLAYYDGPDLTRVSRAKVRILVPCGNDVTRLRDTYDLVALESPDNARLVPDGWGSVLLPPPFFALAEEAVEPSGSLPAAFLLTVFNPWDPVKGADDLAVAADSAPLPIVWCHSNRTLEFDIEPRLAEHPNIIHIDDPSTGEMRSLYERCTAYLSFSRSEGFGWAAADGLRYSRAVVSRPIGVFSFPESHQSGVHLVGETWDFDWSLLDAGSTAPPDRDLSWMSPEVFRRHVDLIVAQH